MTRYVLHPGYVTSRADGDRHFIGGSSLARLYGVDMGQCVFGDTSEYLEQAGDVHLRPRPSGAYKLPEPPIVTVQFDLSPAQVEGAVRDKLIAMGWTPPGSLPNGMAILPVELTAENGAKGLMIGEFFTKVRETCMTCQGSGEDEQLARDCGDCGGEGWNVGRAEVDWTTIKAIWRRAAEYFIKKGGNN